MAMSLAEPGHLLKLDFRDKFDLENNFNCTYDYLEIRDGGHGFDRLISRYCGNTFPPMIISTSRFLWLRFVSDDTIEGAGFTAVYESIPPPPGVFHNETPECIIQMGGYEGWLNSSDIDESYRNLTYMMNKPIDCMWVVNVTEGWLIQLMFKTFELNKPNDCENNFVDIFSPSTEVKYRVNKFCSSMAEMVTSINNILYVRFYVDLKARNSSFTSLYTAYRDGKKEGGCLPDEFDCQDERCIKKELECNGIENCRFRWDDDDHCIPKTGTLADTLRSEHIIIILVIFCLILSGMCFTFIFNCVRKLVHDHRIIQEHMRQSRQSRLDQVGKGKTLVPPIVASTGRSRSNSSSGGGVGGSLSPHHLLRAVRTAVSGSDSHISQDESPHRGTAADECYVPGAGDLMPILMGASRTDSSPTDTHVPTTVPANGDAVFLRDNHHHHHHHHHHHEHEEQAYEEEDDLEMSSFPPPEMRDNECQTRESLFMNTNSDRSLTPPPPPPPASSHRHISRPTPQHSLPPHHSSSTTSAFSTFGYSREHPHSKGTKNESGGSSNIKDSSMSSRTAHQHHHHHHHHQHPMSPESKHFRAEAVIEMEQSSPRRNGSGDETVPPPPPPAGSRPFSVESTKSAPDVIVTH